MHYKPLVCREACMFPWMLKCWSDTCMLNGDAWKWAKLWGMRFSNDASQHASLSTHTHMHAHAQAHTHHTLFVNPQANLIHKYCWALDMLACVESPILFYILLHFYAVLFSALWIWQANEIPSRSLPTTSCSAGPDLRSLKTAVTYSIPSTERGESQCGILQMERAGELIKGWAYGCDASGILGQTVSGWWSH